MAARPQPLPQAEELQEPQELQELEVRVVRLNELGARTAHPATGDAPETVPIRSRPAPQPPPAAHPAPQPPPPSPQPPPAAAKRTAAPAVAPHAQPQPPRRRLLSSGRLFFVLVAALLYLGWNAQTARYISPNRGIGYALGIVAWSLMLLLLVYSLRK